MLYEISLDSVDKNKTLPYNDMFRVMIIVLLFWRQEE